jgi:Peptidase family S41
VNQLKYTILILTIICSSLFTNAQVSKEYNPTITKASAIKDLQIVQNALYKTHPAPFAFISKDSLDYQFAKTISLLPEVVSERYLYVEVRKLLHFVGCGHTTALPSKPFLDSLRKQNKITLAIAIKLVAEKLFITKNDSKDSSIKIGTELLSINNKPAREIIADIRNMLNSDVKNTTHIDYYLADNFATWYYLLYGITPSYTLITKGKDDNITSHVIAERKANTKVIKSSSNIFDTIMKQKSLCLLKQKNIDSIVILRINNFTTKKQNKFFKNVIAYLHKKNIPNLVIDLRGNGGGNIPAATRLLRYLINDKFYVEFSGDKPVVESKYLSTKFGNATMRFMVNFIPTKNIDGEEYHAIGVKPRNAKHYNGKLFVLTDGGTFSAASYVASILKHHANATTLGQETGGGEEGSNGMLQMKYTLPESKIRFIFQYYHFKHDINSNNKTLGLAADYEIEASENGEDISLGVVKSILERK